ncbi:MAG: cytidine deaminase [Chloroflexi bacterium]|nr:cytidine deaminase [Chloroflexota bacterium]
MPEASDQQLIKAAIDASRHAYIPYSNYRVGAALLTAGGAIYGGCNIESVSFTPTVCAERTALFKAVSVGQREFKAIAVVTRDAGSPCGVCRQMMYEFAPDLRVILADLDGNSRLVTTLRELLPHGFGPAHLDENKS